MSQPPEDLSADPGPTVEESEIDRLVAQVSGPEDQVGMAALWRVTMGLPHWWFIAVGEGDEASPAAAEIDGQLMLLTFTDGERARHFAVQQEMIAEQDALNAIALEPQQVIGAADSYRAAEIDGLIFDPHLSGFYIPAEQLTVVWAAVTAPAPADHDGQPLPADES